MPIPKPNKGEAQPDFIDRCMADEAMSEYDEDQRLAICHKSWRDSKKESADPSESELRHIPSEVRAVEDDVGRWIVGTGIVFNELSVEMWGFREVIDPEAVADAIDPDLIVAGNHDENFVLGRVSAGTASLEIDERGVHYRALVNQRDVLAVSMYEKVKRGDVRGSSFRFRVAEDGEKWELREDGELVRRITQMAWIGEMGPVTFPAYPQTSAEVRSKAAELLTQEETGQGADAVPSPSETPAVAAGYGLPQRFLPGIGRIPKWVTQHRVIRKKR